MTEISKENKKTMNALFIGCWFGLMIGLLGQYLFDVSSYWIFLRTTGGMVIFYVVVWAMTKLDFSDNIDD